MATISINSLSVNSGDTLGGFTVIIQGVFSSVSDTYTVKFGTTLATSVTVLDNNNISCVAPAHIQELVGVTVENLTDPVTAIFPNAFTFLNPGNTTLQLIREQAKERADMVHSEFITDSEWNNYINASYKELYDILTQKFGDDYFVAAPYTFITQNNTTQYALPRDFYKLLGVEIQLNTGDPNSWVTMKNFQFIERNRWSYPNIYTFYGITNLRYRLNGNNIMIMPMNQEGQAIRLWYNPRPSLLTNNGSIVDGVSGWEEYIIVDVCIKAWNKQESDPSVFMNQKNALLQRIEEAAENRDAGEASRVSDVKSLSYGYGSGSDGNGNAGW